MSVFVRMLYVDQELTVWEFEPIRETCKVQSTPEDEDFGQPQMDVCRSPINYIGRRKDGKKSELCTEHFHRLRGPVREIRITVF